MAKHFRLVCEVKQKNLGICLRWIDIQSHQKFEYDKPYNAIFLYLLLLILPIVLSQCGSQLWPACCKEQVFKIKIKTTPKP